MKTTPSFDAASRERLFKLLDELQAELAQAGSDDRVQRRWSVQAPVLVGTLEAGAEPPVLEGARQRPTMDFPFSSQFRMICHAWATDISESGIGLLTEKPLEVGQVYQVSLQALLNEPMLVPVSTVYTRRIFTHTYRAGGAFLQDTETV